MPEPVYQQNYPDAQWGDFWGWASGADSTAGPSTDTIDTRTLDESVPQGPGILDDVLPSPVDILSQAVAGAKDTLDKSATAFFANVGRSVGQTMTIVIVGGLAYLAFKDLTKPNLSSKAT